MNETNFPKGLIVVKEELIPEELNMRNGDVFTALELIKTNIHTPKGITIVEAYRLLEVKDENINGKITCLVFDKSFFKELDDLTFKKIKDRKNEHSNKSN